jgi:hypothetical protein
VNKFQSKSNQDLAITSAPSGWRLIIHCTLWSFHKLTNTRLKQDIDIERSKYFPFAPINMEVHSYKEGMKSIIAEPSVGLVLILFLRFFLLVYDRYRVLSFIEMTDLTPKEIS